MTNASFCACVILKSLERTNAMEVAKMLEVLTPQEFNEFLENTERQNAKKQMIFRSSIYLGLIAQGQELRPSRTGQLRELLLNLIGDYFEFGVNPQNKVLLQKQESFLAYTVSEQFNSGRGYKPLLQQIRMLTLIHEPIICKVRSCVCMDRNHREIYTLTSDVSVTITMLSITVLYPHMLKDAAFIKKVVGKVLKYTTKTIVTFTPDNKIISLTSERPFAEAWFDLLQDIEMTGKVIKDMNNNFNTPNLIC